jgi:hypothetical protein
MSDRVDAAVEWVEAAGADTAVDGPRAEAELQELATGDDAMLRRGEVGDLGV